MMAFQTIRVNNYVGHFVIRSVGFPKEIIILLWPYISHRGVFNNILTFCCVIYRSLYRLNSLNIIPLKF